METYKVIQGLSPPLLNEVFVPRQCIYDLRGNKFLERVKSVRYGSDSTLFLALKTWETLSNEKKKDSETLQLFKAKVKDDFHHTAPIGSAKSIWRK